MTRTLLATAAAGLALAFFPTSQADACSCLPPDMAASYNWSSDTLAVQVKRERVVGGNRFYLARVIQPYSGCTTMGERIVLQTPRDSATCGETLSVGDRWIVHGNVTSSVGGLPTFSIGSCDDNKLVSSLTADEQNFLDSRMVVCPSTGAMSCADGTPPVTCLVDPCSTAPACPTGDCYDNYCGGCNFEYFDAFGKLTCPSVSL